MSHLYATIRADHHATRGRTSRRAHSGIVTCAASWDGAVRTSLARLDDGRVAYKVELVEWSSAGAGKVREVLAAGFTNEGTV